MTPVTTLPVHVPARTRSRSLEGLEHQGDRLVSPPSERPAPSIPRQPEPGRKPRLAGLSLTSILRSFFRKDPRPTGQVQTELRKPADEVRTGDADTRSPPHDDLLDADELDPLPFVIDDDSAFGPVSSPSGAAPATTGRDALPMVRRVCVVTCVAPPVGAASAGRGRFRESPGSWECRLLEVNMTGLALHSAHAFERRSILSVHFSTQFAERGIELAGTVVRCEPSRRGGFQIVVRLERPLRSAEIREIGRDLFASAIV